MAIEAEISDPAVKRLFSRLLKHGYKTPYEGCEILGVDVHPKEGDAIAIMTYSEFNYENSPLPMIIRKYCSKADDYKHFILVNVAQGKKGLSTSSRRDPNPLTNVKNVYLYVDDYEKFPNIPLWLRAYAEKIIFNIIDSESRVEVNEILWRLDTLISRKTLPELAKILFEAENVKSSRYASGRVKKNCGYVPLGLLCCNLVGYEEYNHGKDFNEWLNFIMNNDYCSPNMFFDQNKLMTVIFGDNWTTKAVKNAPKTLKSKVINALNNVYIGHLFSKISLEKAKNKTLLNKVALFMHDMPETFKNSYGANILASSEYGEYYPLIALSYLYAKYPDRLKSYDPSIIEAVLENTNQEWEAVCNILICLSDMGVNPIVENDIYNSIFAMLDACKNYASRKGGNIAHIKSFLASYRRKTRDLNQKHAVDMYTHIDNMLVRLVIGCDLGFERVKNTGLSNVMLGLDGFKSLTADDVETVSRMEDFVIITDFNENSSRNIMKAVSPLFLGKPFNDAQSDDKDITEYHCRYFDNSSTINPMFYGSAQYDSDVTVFHILNHLILSSLRRASEASEIPETLILQRFYEGYLALNTKNGNKTDKILTKTYLQLYKRRGNNYSANLSLILIYLLNNSKISIFDMTNEFIAEQIQLVVNEMLASAKRLPERDKD